jgi:phenylacetate-CoA ligase
MLNDRVGHMVVQFRAVLAETERLAPDKLHAYQKNLLERLVQHAYRNVPFYQARLTPLFRGAKPDLSHWNELPILTRAEAQHNTTALTATTVPANAGAVDKGETSGSTGRPLSYLVNELVNVGTLGTTDRALRWWKFDGNKTMATFVARKRDSSAISGEVTVTGWRVGFPGPHHMIPISSDNDKLIDRLVTLRPNYLTGQSFTLLGLAERVRARGIDLHFERINSTSTALSDEIRGICKDVLGARPIDQYGARETGLIACECPWCGHYHINAETMLVEILDASGQPSAPGDVGRVVLTSLYNYAMPFIRYEIGDFAVAGPRRVKCRIKLPVLTKIMGRYRNSFTLHDGRVIFPFLPVARLREFISFEQFQVVQTDYKSIEVRYVPLDRSRIANVTGLEQCVRELIDPTFSVQAVAVDSIPRSASGKFEDYLSLVPHHADQRTTPESSPLE